MKIFVTGTRGIPDIPGGVETHCQQLYPHIASRDIDITVATRLPYVREKREQWRNVALRHIFAPRKKSLEAIVHTFLAVCRARSMGADILHIHAVGPGLLVPFARMLGLKVVFTNHGPDYNRQKWGWFARKMLRLGEYLGGTYAHEVIVISHAIGDIVRNRCGREPVLIPNGVDMLEKSENTDYLSRIGVQPGGFILAVSRFVPEKGLELLIEAFRNARTDVKLVIAGDADHESEYSLKIKRVIASDDRIIPTGYITGEPLRQVFSHARLFVLPSYHEGLPIALLEALACELPVIVSDIPAHLEIELNPDRYFRSGDATDLKFAIEHHLNRDMDETEKEAIRRMIRGKYDWSRIAAQTVDVYRKVLENRMNKR